MLTIVFLVGGEGNGVMETNMHRTEINNKYDMILLFNDHALYLWM